MPDAPRQNIDHLRATVPVTLQARPQWVCWRRKGDQKLPVNPRTGRAASTTDPMTWGTFEDAIQAYSRSGGKLAGIGFVFTEGDRYCGVDLDDVIDDDGNLAPWAARIVEKFKTTYIEVSPSGHGLKVFMIGKKPAGAGCNANGIECYDRGRYFTVTGNQWPGSAADVRDCQSALDWLCGEYLSTPVLNTPTPHHNLASEGSEGSNGSGGSEGSEGSEGSGTVEQVIMATLPKEPRHRDRGLMFLARGLKFDAGLGDRPVAEMKPIVRRWHELSLPVIGTKPFGPTWDGFIRAWGRAKVPLFGGGLAAVLERAKANPEPRADENEEPQVQLLVALCRELAGPDSVFYLSQHTAGRLLGVDPALAGRWLKRLVADEWLAVTKKGAQGRGPATRYRWLRGESEGDSSRTVEGAS